MSLFGALLLWGFLGTPLCLFVSLKVSKALRYTPAAIAERQVTEGEAELDRLRAPFLAEAVREVDAIVPPGSNFQ